MVGWTKPRICKGVILSMGRRTHDHRFVKYIVMLDSMGRVKQRHELDSNGRLMHHPQHVPEYIPQAVPIVPQYHPIPLIDDIMGHDQFTTEPGRKVPIPPKMRQKPHFMVPVVTIPEDGLIEQSCY